MNAFTKGWRFFAIVLPVLTYSLEMRSYLLSPVLDWFPRYPPIIIAIASATLFAQTYISSYPAASMVLISPPTSTQGHFHPDSCGLSFSSPASSSASINSLHRHGAGFPLPTPLPEFNYEPRFPILLLGDSRNRARMLSNHRLLKGAHESTFVSSAFLEALEEEQVFTEITTWLDELGL